MPEIDKSCLDAAASDRAQFKFDRTALRNPWKREHETSGPALWKSQFEAYSIDWFTDLIVPVSLRIKTLWSTGLAYQTLSDGGRRVLSGADAFLLLYEYAYSLTLYLYSGLLHLRTVLLGAILVLYMPSDYLEQSSVHEVSQCWHTGQSIHPTA